MVGIVAFFVYKILKKIDKKNLIKEKDIKITDNNLIMDKKTKLKLEMLKDEKDDLKFESGKILDYFLGLLIFLATIGITVTLAVSGFWLRLFTAILFALLIIMLYFCLFRQFIGKKTDDYIIKKKQIKQIYLKLEEKK